MFDPNPDFRKKQLKVKENAFSSTSFHFAN